MPRMCRCGSELQWMEMKRSPRATLASRARSSRRTNRVGLAGEDDLEALLGEDGCGASWRWPARRPSRCVPSSPTAPVSWPPWPGSTTTRRNLRPSCSARVTSLGVRLPMARSRSRTCVGGAHGQERPGVRGAARGSAAAGRSRPRRDASGPSADGGRRRAPLARSATGGPEATPPRRPSGSSRGVPVVRRRTSAW